MRQLFLSQHHRYGCAGNSNGSLNVDSSVRSLGLSISDTTLPLCPAEAPSSPIIAMSPIFGKCADIVVGVCWCRSRLLFIIELIRAASNASPRTTPTTIPAMAPALKVFAVEVKDVADVGSGIVFVVPFLVSFAVLIIVPDESFRGGTTTLPSLTLLERRQVRVALGAASVMGRSEATIGIHAVINGVTHQLAMYQVAVLGSPN